MPASYRIDLHPHPKYLHASVTGTHTPKNVARFLREVREACVHHGLTSVLIEVNFTGPSLATGSIYDVVAREAPQAKMLLRRIAYVDASPRDPEKKKFAETVALNRGVNVRLFPTVAEAARWLEESEPVSRSDR